MSDFDSETPAPGGSESAAHNPVVRGTRSVLVRGDRVHLRYPRWGDFEEYQELKRASEAFLRPWVAAPVEGVDSYGEEVFRAFLRSRRNRRGERTLICRNADGAILGGVNLNEIVRGIFHSAYLGYWVGEPYAGKGYMGEALDLTLIYGFEDLGLHRMEANIQPTNEPSLALVRRAGFRREGFSPRYLQIAGEWRDHERWAITVEEWRRPEG